MCEITEPCLSSLIANVEKARFDLRNAETILFKAKVFGIRAATIRPEPSILDAWDEIDGVRK